MRRGLIGLSALGALPAVLGACAQTTRRASLPDVHWPSEPIDAPPSRTSARPSMRKWEPLPDARTPGLPDARVMPRSRWAQGMPVPRLMNKMLPVNRITLHHDGMSVFTSRADRDAIARLETIRQSHRNRGWGDIGYHFLIDPAGRVWEGRPLGWQGAHVAAQNEGNIGICIMGNYEQQRPTQTQIDAIERFTGALMNRYRVGTNRIYTHQELAQTACPGRNLQRELVAARRPGGGLYLA